MLSKEQQAALDALLRTASSTEAAYMAGYLAHAASSGANGAVLVHETAQSAKPPVAIYYATETGNTKALSLEVMRDAKARGYKVRAASVNRVKVDDIAPTSVAIFLISTHGEGDPPEAAVEFFARIKAAPDGTLAGLSYVMLGLGDKSYDIFCGAAVSLDAELARLGAIRLGKPTLLDVDYAQHTAAWLTASLDMLDSHAGAANQAGTTIAAAGTAAANAAPAQQQQYTGRGYSRLEPITATIKEHILLNDVGSAKATYHLELTLAEPIPYTAGDALGVLPPNDATPRLYSIASSPSFHEGEVHLTVALATHTSKDDSEGFGLCSKYLADAKVGDTLTCYIAHNQLFNLPADDQDAIMIGPGTGIAPFRGFIYERAERGASGRNWLLFGEQHAHCDFLYQAEWQEHLATGALTHMDVAFSRDGAEKNYVQHKLLENEARFMEWLDAGAAVYVCGAKDPMSRDVERTMIEILAAQRGVALDAAKDMLADLADAGRYVKDVY